MRDYLQDMLHAACVEVQVAASGAEALTALSQNARAFDAVVLDSKMPEQDGVTTASRLRRIDGGATVPLILLAPPGKHKSEAYQALFAAVLNKPIRPLQLMATLRRVLSGAAPPPPTPAPATPATINLPALAHPLRVLLAEDNLINQKVTVALLARLGCRQGVDVVANGLEALQAVQQRPYDVVLMDVHMPDMDGLAATRAIRGQLPPEQRPYIIAITAAAMQGDAEQCLAAGMDAYVSKPVRLEELANVLAGVPLLGAPGAVPDNAATVDPEEVLKQSLTQGERMGKRIVLEMCIDSVELAVAAQQGGADRVELCDNLIEGGTTPSTGTIALARKHITIDLNVIIRPRGGDFCYSDVEFDVMKYDIETAKRLGANGVVIGLLKPDGALDVGRMRTLVELARPLSVTCHRAFDVCRDPFEALDQSYATGCGPGAHHRPGSHSAGRAGHGHRAGAQGRRSDHHYGRRRH